MQLGRTVLRAVIGPLMVGHGTQKLFGWFGGHGLEQTGGWFESIGLRPGKRHATAAGASEALGGALLTLGLLTPLGCSLVTAVMTTAIRRVHAEKGPWVTEGGFEYNALLMAAVFELAETGPGRLSLDSAIAPRFKGPGWALLQLAGGIAGSFLATDVLNEAPPEEQGTAQRVPGDPAAAGGNGRPAYEPAAAHSS